MSTWSSLTHRYTEPLYHKLKPLDPKVYQSDLRSGHNNNIELEMILIDINNQEAMLISENIRWFE